jgi:catechol 2,3-dioxygenase-like lactoylglutathione lyase family enzyme
MSSPRFAHVGLTVSDLDQMIAFFTDMLGFELKTRLRPFDPGAVAGIIGIDEAVVEEIAYLGKGDTTFELLQYRAPAPTRSTLRPCDPGYMHWLVEVDDTAAAIDRAAGHGFLLVREPYLIAAGPNIGKTGTYLRHPDGFSLEIIGPRPQ